VFPFIGIFNIVIEKTEPQRGYTCGSARGRKKNRSYKLLHNPKIIKHIIPIL